MPTRKYGSVKFNYIIVIIAIVIIMVIFFIYKKCALTQNNVSQ